MRVCGFQCSQRPPSDFIYKTAVKVASAACRQRKKRHRYFQFFSILVLAPRMLLFTFVGYFSKKKRISIGFISIFACRMIFWSQKVPGDDALRMFVWNKDSYCFSTCWSPNKCFSHVSFLSNFQKTIVLIVSIAFLGVSHFDKVF